MSFASSSNVGLYIHPRTGNVGIGTTVALSAFHVRANTGSSTSGMVIDQVGAGGILDIRDGGVSKVVVNANGYVGIGTSIPLTSFHINGSIRQTNSFEITDVGTYYTDIKRNIYFDNGWKSLSGGPGSLLVLGGGSSSDSFISLRTFNSSQGIAPGTAITQVEAMRIIQDGNVGIGTTLPNSLLTITGSSGIAVNGVYQGAGGYIKPYIVPGVVSGVSLGALNTSGNPLNCLYLNDSGYVGIGTNNPQNSVHFFNGNITFQKPGTTTCDFRFQNANRSVNIALFGSGSAMAFYDNNISNSIAQFATGSGNLWIGGSLTQNGFSDRRLKTNIQPIPNALSKICALKGHTFDYRIPRDDGRQSDVSFIAQEFQEVFPEWISEGIINEKEQALLGEGEKALNFSTPPGLFAYLVEAIKEQQSQISDLKAQLQTLYTHLNITLP